MTYLRYLFPFIIFIKVIHSVNKENYEFGMFENLELLQKLFIDDHRLFRELSDYKHFLHQEIDLLRKVGLRNNVRETLTRLRRKYEMTQSVTSSYENHFGERGVNFHNALKGLVLLVDTYQLKVSDLITGNKTKTGLTAGPYSLKPDDVIMMSRKSFNMKWFDTSIRILREVQPFVNIPRDFTKVVR